MTEIHIKLDPNKLTLWDMEKHASRDADFYPWAIDFLSRLACNADGEPIPYEEAKSKVRSLTPKEAIAKIEEAFAAITVPKVTDTA